MMGPELSTSSANPQPTSTELGADILRGFGLGLEFRV